MDPATNPYVGGDHSVGSQRKAFEPLPHLMLSELDFSCLTEPNVSVISDLASYADEDEEFGEMMDREDYVPELTTDDKIDRYEEENRDA